MGGFLHPLLLWGTALVAVPILIHLLNRRRYQKLPWAAMNFLLAAHKKNRRRIRVENLLLLFLRCAGVVILAFAIARPFLEEPPPVAKGERRKDAVIVLDHSYSMGWRDGLDSPFQRGVAAAEQAIERLKPERGDQVTILAAKSHPQVLSWKDPVKAREALRGLETPSFEASNFPATLDGIVRIAEDFGEGGEISIVWISDLQKLSLQQATGGSPNKPKEDRRQSALLAQLAERGATLQVVDVGPSSMRPSNLGVIALEAEEPAAEFAGAAVTFRAQIRNHSDLEKAGVRVFLEKDGARFGSQTVDLPARTTRDASFTVPMEEAGTHWISASIENDSLPADDTRYHALWVRPPVRALLVDGESTLDDPESSETWHLKNYFHSADEDDGLNVGFPFRIEVADRGRFFANPELLQNFDLCVLANIESYSEGSVGKLEAFAAGGGALLWILGDRIEAGYYNTLLHAATFDNLLPAKLLVRHAVGSRRTEYFRIAYPDFDHPAFAPFRDPQWRPLLTEVPVYEFWRVALESADTGTRVLAALDDADRSPFLVEKSFGRGKVSMLTSPASTKWNRLAESPKTFLPFFFELFRSLTSRETRERDLFVRDAIAWSSAQFPRKAAWVAPNGTRHPVDATPHGETGAKGIERYTLPAIAETSMPGVYTIEMEVASGPAGVETEKTHFAINVVPEEGDLERIPREAVPGYFPGLGVQLESSGETVVATTQRNKDRGEIWVILLAAALGVLALESILAAWFGRRRSDRDGKVSAEKAAA